MEEKGCMEFCAASVAHLRGKKLRMRLLPGEGDKPVCEICGAPVDSCGCRGNAALYEPDTDSWICDKCFEGFKEFLLLTVE